MRLSVENPRDLDTLLVEEGRQWPVPDTVASSKTLCPDTLRLADGTVSHRSPFGPTCGGNSTLSLNSSICSSSHFSTHAQHMASDEDMNKWLDECIVVRVDDNVSAFLKELRRSDHPQDILCVESLQRPDEFPTQCEKALHAYDPDGSNGRKLPRKRVSVGSQSPRTS